jgi:hypothetical protein
MCGIVGLYLKNPALESQLGKLFEPMLEAMTDRGPDSAGFAIYGDEVGDGWVKLTLQATTDNYDFKALVSALEGKLGASLDWFQNASAIVLKIQAEEAAVRAALGELAPTVRIMSAGKSIEILKGMGLPKEISERFGLGSMKGSHIIGHTRMATESAVTMEGSHPFSTGADLCLVHNGSLSNHSRLRQELRREGINFDTENDTEVAAGYLAWRLQQGDSLKTALDSSLEALDGFFTFAIGTRNGFAVIRDPIACGATAHGGLLVIKGNAASRCGISMKGIDIVVQWQYRPHVGLHGPVRALVVLGDAGDALGDSLYEAKLFVKRQVEAWAPTASRKECARASRRAAELLNRAGVTEKASEFKRYGSARSSTISTSTTPPRTEGREDHELSQPLYPASTQVGDLRSIIRLPGNPRAAATGIYDIRGAGTKRKVPHFDDLLVLGASISRYPLEGYREKCDTSSSSAPLRQEADPSEDADHHCRHELRRAVGNAKEALGRGATIAGTSDHHR